MARGVTRKQLLNEPDQFITFTGKLIAFGRTHLKAILIGLGALTAVLLIVVIVRQVSYRNEIRAAETVEKAVAKYRAALQDTDPVTAYDRVKNDFTEIFSDHGDKSTVNVARIVYGDICYHAGDADAAVAMYSRALEEFGQSPSLKNILLSGLGHAHVLKKEYPQSIRYFEMISENEEATLKSDALFNLAWLYEATGNKDRSPAIYQRLLDDFPDTLYGDLIREKING